MTEPALSVVVAVKDAGANVAAVLAALGEPGPAVEILFCVAGAPPAALSGGGRAIRTLAAPGDSLVPHLWRDGIRQARAPRVALTTAQCIPAEDWVRRLTTADTARWPGIGGAIDNDPAATPRNWAIFFLRYLAFAPPLAEGTTREIAADNAVYDRDAVLAHPDLLEHGFWEPSFHDRFHAAGRTLRLDPGLLVTHHGLVRARDFVAQRHAHGREYGLARGGGTTPLRRLGLLARSPLLTPLILARILRRLRERPLYRRHLPGALPWLMLFAGAWASGEALGYAVALVGRNQHD